MQLPLSLFILFTFSGYPHPARVMAAIHADDIALINSNGVISSVTFPLHGYLRSFLRCRWYLH